MARSGDLIKQYLYNTIVSLGTQVGLTIVPANWSDTDYKKLTLDSVADGQSIHEQLFDSLRDDIEERAKVLAPQTYPWFRDKMLNLFEYNAITVPIVQLDETTQVPYYPSPNPSQRIIKYCSVVPGIFGTTLIKIAGDSSGSPTIISGSPLSAAQTFANIIGVPGITYNVVSYNADRLFMQLDVYYDGLYSAVIEQRVVDKIKSFLLNFSTNNFNGTFLTSLLENEILKVEGVKDVVIDNLKARPYTTAVGGGTSLILNNLELLRSYLTTAGHMIPEDTSGANWRLTDFRVGSSGIKNLNLIAQ